MRLKLCMNGEWLWDSVLYDLPGGVDYDDVADWWREAATAVFDEADIEYDLSGLGFHAWNGENTHTGQCGGLMWWGEPTAEERAAIERASDAGDRAVCREALLCFGDDTMHWHSTVSELLAEGADGADAELAHARESLEQARRARALIREEFRGDARELLDGWWADDRTIIKLEDRDYAWSELKEIAEEHGLSLYAPGEWPGERNGGRGVVVAFNDGVGGAEVLESGEIEDWN